MNSYYLLLQTLKSQFEQDVNVNTVISAGDDTMLDDYRKNLYPIVQIEVINSPSNLTTNAVTTYNVEITVVDQRDISKEEVNDKFWRNDNFHDNLNTTRAILKRAQMRLAIADGLDLTGVEPAQPLTFVKQNLLDGWQQTWTIDIEDEIHNSCNILSILSYTPETVASAGEMSSFSITFNVVPTINTGSVVFYDSNGNVMFDADEGFLTQNTNSRTVVVDTDSTPMHFPADDVYYVLIESGLFTFNGTGFEVNDTNLITITVG